MGKESAFVWASAVVLLVVQQYLIFSPPLWLGSVFLPLVMETLNLCQTAVDMVMGTVTSPEDDFSHLTLVPLSIIMIVAVYSMDRAIRMLVTGKIKEKGEIRTFSECFLRLVYYFMMFFVVLYVISLEDYWPDTKNCWTDFVSRKQPMPRELQATYLFELAYYTGGVFIHIFLNEHLKDFTVMLSHHVITVALLGLSYAFGYHRIGMLVLMCHDGCDVYLDGGKCFNSFKKDAYAMVTVISLLVAWAYYRLYVFPVKVILDGQRYSFIAAQEQGMESGTPLIICFVLLWILVCLHVYWFLLIVRVGIKKLRGGDLVDVRQKKHAKKQK
eukprot:m.136242 g.136242  ORF g.136242 m.136242 type:complete len:328 (-) comp10536_c0_seq1:156-1139(-)